MSERVKGMTVSRPRLSDEYKRKATKKKTSHNEQEKDEGLYVIKIKRNYVSKIDMWYDWIPYMNKYNRHMIYLGHEVKARHIRDAHIFDSLSEVKFIQRESGGVIYRLQKEMVR